MTGRRRIFPLRRNQVARRRSDGRFDLVLEDRLRDVARHLLEELEQLVEGSPDDPSLRRLNPPAYLDDPDNEAAYQILAGDELRSSRRAAIATVRESLDREVLTEDELWTWMQALNSLRLVVGTRLGIEDDDDARQPRTVDEDDPDAPMWAVYEFATYVQYDVIKALGG